MRLAVVGNPIAHSLSPAIHAAALAALGLDGEYVAIRAEDGELGAVIDRIRQGELDGLNVTMPHKRAASRLVDQLTPDARRSSSVNTIVRSIDGALVGHSTDITAMRRLWTSGSLPVNRAILVLGAGGAAAAACLAAPGHTVYVSARRPEASTALARELDLGAVAIPWGAAVADAVVVNATALGMQGEELPAMVMPLASGLVDMAYGPETTPAVAVARQGGLPAVDGLDVLVAQAGDSLRLWTGHEPPWEAMAAAARNPSSPPTGVPNHSQRRGL